MKKVCKICGKEFETTYPQKKYCSAECAIRAKSRVNVRCNAKRAEAKRRAWARHEAEILYHAAQKSGVDGLAEYIYNKFNKRRKTK